eukprot:5888178-Amphidinium_carterae.1
MPVYSGRIAIPAPIDEAYMKGAACSPGIGSETALILNPHNRNGQKLGENWGLGGKSESPDDGAVG